jgi:hypothetical protein
LGDFIRPLARLGFCCGGGHWRVAYKGKGDYYSGRLFFGIFETDILLRILS